MAKRENFLYEKPDRWELDTLIPKRDRIRVQVQIERTSKPRVATKAVIVRDKLIPGNDKHPLELVSHAETALERQRRLRGSQVDEKEWEELSRLFQ